METKREWTTIKEYEEIFIEKDMQKLDLWRRPHYDQPGTVSQRFYPDYDHGDERRLLHLPGTPGH